MCFSKILLVRLLLKYNYCLNYRYADVFSTFLMKTELNERKKCNQCLIFFSKNKAYLAHM